MKYLIVLTATLVAASASFIGHPGYPYAPQPYHQVAPYYAPYTPSSQHHSQDEYGNFAYGYENVNSQKSESGNAYGAVKGQYSYIDAYGKSQTVDYVADDYGFRASGTNLVNSADALNTGYRHKRSAIYPYAPTLAYSIVATHPTALYNHAAPAAVAHHGPAAIHASPVAAHHGPAPAAHTAIASSQYRTQDEYDNFSFGYANENSQRQESGNGYGGVSGSYSYVDAYGKPHTVNYVADDLGFRATGTDLVNSAYADKAYRKKRSIGYPAYPSYAPHAYAPVARAYAPHPIASIPAYHAPASKTVVGSSETLNILPEAGEETLSKAKACHCIQEWHGLSIARMPRTAMKSKGEMFKAEMRVQTFSQDSRALGNTVSKNNTFTSLSLKPLNGPVGELSSFSQLDAIVSSNVSTTDNELNEALDILADWNKVFVKLSRSITLFFSEFQLFQVLFSQKPIEFYPQRFGNLTDCKIPFYKISMEKIDNTESIEVVSDERLNDVSESLKKARSTAMDLQKSLMNFGLFCVKFGSELETLQKKVDEMEDKFKMGVNESN
ncbi:unnamed protein product [Lepeophtheirus salmonis]|uniref:(salmon louse) hypothetical protein n=1 Tax=Lepeophtheirus salmonis TaxID=72036 RepID=A0A7R8CU29_LEPSM|nr:unnamed protein product [Lepeophtheirus salmonis]CAF2931616.1 unnamed protein product [Lepeophtheirus salmonis]